MKYDILSTIKESKSTLILVRNTRTKESTTILERKKVKQS